MRSGWHALKWNTLGNLARGLSQFAIGILLARLLGPTPFGIVALASMVIGLGRLFADLGFGAALVQRETLSDAELRFVFTWQMAFALLLAAGGILGADLLAATFHAPQAAPVLRAMFCLFIIDCPGNAAAALLRRALNFKAVQQIGIASYLIGYVAVGIPAAWLGYGAWSLVAAQLTQSLLSCVLLLRAAPLPWRPCLRCATPGLAGFGVKVAAANLSSWTISNLDTAMIGRAFGVVDLGLYSRALNLVNTPMSIVTTGFQGVLFAACSRAQGERARLRNIHIETGTAVALVCVPVFAAAAAIPDTLILGVYGQAWAASIPMVTPLALAVLVNALLAIHGPVLMAMDKVGVELRNQIATIVLFVPALALAVRFSLQATAWTIFATFVLRWLLLTRSTLRSTGAGMAEYARSLRFPFLLGLAVALVAGAADRGLAGLPPTLRLLCVMAASGATVLALAQRFGALCLKRHLATLVDVEHLAVPLKKFLNA
jgi:O-antigen/teichoic acid export membrane protein